MKRKQILSLLLALAMALSIMPGLAFADGASLPLESSFITTTVSTTPYTMDGYTDRPYAVSWSNDAGFRMGVVVFDASEIDKDSVGMATLGLTVSRTQNVNEGSSTSTVTVYAIDPAEADSTNAVKPTIGQRVGVISLSGITTQSQSLTSPVSAEIDLSEYFAAYPDADKIALLLTNREDIAECNSRGLVGFYGSSSAAYAPTLTLIETTSVKVELTDGETVMAASTVDGLTIGSSFTPDSSAAPLYLIYNNQIYTRDSLPTVTVESGTPVQVTYSEGAEFSDRVILGNAPLLPQSFASASGGSLSYVDASWNADGSVTAGTVTYTASIDGYTGEDVTAEVEVLPCDHSVDTFYSAGGSSSASFSWYNSLGYTYGGGNVIFETDFVNNAETNKLITYGDGTTNSFGGGGPMLRYMNAADSNGNYVFEYYNGTTGAWVASSVVCEAGMQYRLRTEVNMDDKTYRMYVAGEDGVYSEITNGAVGFRSSTLAAIDRVFFHGIADAGEFEDGIVLSHRAYWVDGYTNLTVNYVDEDGNGLAESKTIKWTDGATYTASDAPKAIMSGGAAYVLEDVTADPEKVVSGESDVFDIVYYRSDTPTVSEVAEVNTVQGEALNMPSTVSVTFSNGQSLVYPAVWDTSSVDTDEPGTYTVTGTVEGLAGVTASCTVNIKAVTYVDYEEGNVTVATNNGGWNWYVEPSGTHIQPGDALATRYESGAYSSNNDYVFQHDRTYMGWVEDDGAIIVSQLDHETGEYKRVEIHDKLESDDHNNPAVVILPDGRIMAVYSMHTNEPYMYFRVSKNPEDISEWNDEWYYYCQTTTETETATYNATYPTVFMVHDDEGIEGNDVIYVGWRGVHWKPTLAKFSMPDENGQLSVVMGQTQFANTTYSSGAKVDGGASDSGRRPYTKYDYDFERNKIYITFTANHPDNDRLNHIYYLYLDIEDQNLYTAKDNLLQPLPVENSQSYASQGANGTNGQWGVVTVDLVDAYPELLVFNASEQTGEGFGSGSSGVERRGWTWDIKVNEKGEPCIVYVDITATPPTEDNGLPTWYLAPQSVDDKPYSDNNSRSHHYYWYARWDSETQQWVKTFLTYGGKWFHENATQERCYSGGLTFDHNAEDANVIFLAIPTMGEYGNIFEIYRWESDDHGATWTIREPITQNSPTNNARPNAIYNYKQDPETGENLGPRLLWISGEYRYWMNYEYKTGVKTDYATEGFVTQDDPEMFADSTLMDAGGAELEVLPIGEGVELNAKFNITNISIGDGTVKLALAHYSGDNELKDFVSTEEITIPGRSVPQTGIIGAPKTADGGTSTLGSPEVVETISYTAESIEEGDRIVLFAWNMGIEHPMSSISTIPYEITTDGSRYLMEETFTYEGTEKLILDQDESTFNGWVAKGYNSDGAVEFTDNSYVAVTKAPFGNTALHLYRVGGEGLMVSHALPETDEDYTIEFTMRHIDEMSWNNTNNQGFTLSHGIPTARGDESNSASAFQYRYRSAWRDENGRGTAGMVRNTLAFDGGSATEIFHDIYEDNRLWKGDGVYTSVTDGYFDTDDRVYIHDTTDALMTGSLYHIWVTVRPSNRSIELAVDDGYRTATYTTFYNDFTSYDWDANPIDTITFSIGNENWGEVYIDDFRVYSVASDGEELRTASVQTADGAALLGYEPWYLVPVDGYYAFINSDGTALDVNGQGLTVGTSVGTYEYNGGDNQLFSLVETDGGYYIQGRQSGLYLSVASGGTVSLQNMASATIFTVTDLAEVQTVDLEAFIAELAGN